MTQRVALTGASGFLGGALSSSLAAAGHEVVTFVRRTPEGPQQRGWDPASGTLDPADLADVDVVVNLSGAGIADERWSPGRKREILRSRVDATRTLALALAEGAGPTRLVNGSAIGWYGDRGDELLTEDSLPGEGFLPEVVRAWEEAAGPAVAAGISTAFARTGIVLAPGGGAMGPMLTVGRLGLGGPLGDGKQWMPWITREDWCRALVLLVERPDLTGPVDVVGPAPARQQDIAREIGRALGRPAVLPAPSLALRLLLGEMSADLLASTRVLPERLRAAGFRWQQPDLATAIRWVLDEDERLSGSRGSR